MPSDFADVIKVLDGKRHELVWDIRCTRVQSSIQQDQDAK